MATGVAITLTLALLLLQWHERRVTYQGRSALEWSRVLVNGTPEERAQAEIALRALGHRAVPPLCRALLKSDSRLRNFSQRIATRAPAGVRRWLQRTVLPSDPNRDRQAAARALVVLGPAAHEALPILARGLEHPQPSTAWQTASALAQFGPPAVPVALPLLDHRDAAVRLHATWVLGQIGPPAQPAEAALLRQLGETNQAVAAATAYALGRIWTNPLPAYLNLLRTLRGPPREAVARAARQFGFPMHALQPPLVDMLNDPHPGARQVAVITLGSIPGWTAETFAGLHRALGDPDAGVRSNAVAMLAEHQIRPRALPWELGRLLGDPTCEFRVEAAQSLGLLGARAATAIPALEAATRDADTALREAALEALRRITNAPP